MKFFLETVLVMNDNNVFDMCVFSTLTTFVGNIISNLLCASLLQYSHKSLHFRKLLLVQDIVVPLIGGLLVSILVSTIDILHPIELLVFHIETWLYIGFEIRIEKSRKDEITQPTTLDAVRVQ